MDASDNSQKGVWLRQDATQKEKRQIGAHDTGPQPPASSLYPSLPGEEPSPFLKRLPAGVYGTLGGGWAIDGDSRNRATSVEWIVGWCQEGVLSQALTKTISPEVPLEAALVEKPNKH